jgi:hypothetical protein
VNREFLQHCETEPFDENYIEEVFKNMCSLREQIFSDAKQNISSAQTRMKADYDKKKGKPKVKQVCLYCKFLIMVSFYGNMMLAA